MGKTIDEPTIKAFLDAYKLWPDKQTSIKRDLFRVFAHRWKAFRQKIESVQAENAPDFNIFSILGVGHLEVGLLKH